MSVLKAEELRAKIRLSLAIKAENRVTMEIGGPPPRYDEVFYQGTLWLDGLHVKETCMERRCFKITDEGKVQVPFESLLQGDAFILIDEDEGVEDGKTMYVAETDAYINSNNVWEVVTKVS